MPRVIGIDPGTVTLDICGLDDGRVFLDRSFPTAEALSDPGSFVGLLEEAHRDAAIDLIVGPSGYGLPLAAARDLTDTDLKLAFLAAEGESGGIGGLRTLVRALGRSPLPVVLTPGVIHLNSVPAHRKVNRVDMGTADKVCATALAIHAQAKRCGCAERDVSFILLELGGAFSAAIAVDDGRIVDGLGGSSGPLGARAAGALDGEVAFLAGTVAKRHVFAGGVAAIAESSDASIVETLTAPATDRERLAREAYLESAVKAVAMLAVSVPRVRDVIVSGRFAAVPGLYDGLEQRLARVITSPSVGVLTGFAGAARQAAQGAALVADGLAGGRFRSLVDVIGLRDASGTALDHLHVITPAQARQRLGIV
jgi:predicted butyrate kinase (DUF1464 family)